MKIHFIGIGGIGVSALAQYYLEKGHQVSGSDLVASEITEFMQKKGAKVFIGQSAENIKQDLDLVIYSPAVKEDNIELKIARKFQISNFKFQILSYPEALGKLTKEFYTIAVSGSHGKSTTTAMMALILIEAGLDPTVIVGTKLKEFNNSNFRAGKSKYLVIEACEYDSSFLHYEPKIIVVTNIDKEHLDYFKTLANVKKAFKDFIAKLPADGYLVFNINEKTLRQAQGKDVKKIKSILKVPGTHNVYNALDALQVARFLKIKDEITFKALSKFTGTWRRFEEREVQISNFKFQIISDYAHHPNEIKATFQAIREKYPKEKIWCVFQPHQHQRTYYLFNDFVKIFKSAKIDKIIITDIYDVAGREVGKINKQVSSEKLVKKINKKSVLYMPAQELENYVKKNINHKDVLLIMGAGDIYKLSEKF
jgi:UDP-N-acetylmuramate--alanine ligase